MLQQTSRPTTALTAPSPATPAQSKESRPASRHTIALMDHSRATSAPFSGCRFDLPVIKNNPTHFRHGSVDMYRREPISLLTTFLLDVNSFGCAPPGCAKEDVTILAVSKRLMCPLLWFTLCLETYHGYGSQFQHINDGNVCYIWRGLPTLGSYVCHAMGHTLCVLKTPVSY